MSRIYRFLTKVVSRDLWNVLASFLASRDKFSQNLDMSDHSGIAFGSLLGSQAE